MKILAIDDERDILNLIKNALKKEYEVITVNPPNEQIPSDLSTFDLIIMDVMMPGEDGYSLCQRVRNDVDCPILFLTARNTEDDVVYGLSIGADDYLKKPFSVAELRARIQAHLRREKREHAQIIKEGKVFFYLQEKIVKVDDVEVKLTKSEYDIALFLAKNHGQVFSKEQIYEKIYGFDKDGFDTAITEHIKNLRRKLQTAGVNPIETVWGIGYRWIKEQQQ